MPAVLGEVKNLADYSLVASCVVTLLAHRRNVALQLWSALPGFESAISAKNSVLHTALTPERTLLSVGYRLL